MDLMEEEEPFLVDDIYTLFLTKKEFYFLKTILDDFYEFNIDIPYFQKSNYFYKFNKFYRKHILDKFY